MLEVQAPHEQPGGLSCLCPQTTLVESDGVNPREFCNGAELLEIKHRGMPIHRLRVLKDDWHTCGVRCTEHRCGHEHVEVPGFELFSLCLCERLLGKPVWLLCGTQRPRARLLLPCPGEGGARRAHDDNAVLPALDAHEYLRPEIIS